MNAETPDMLHPAQAERRPAIWPWLVMPLIALAAFYCLERLAQDARDQDDLGGRPVAAAHGEASPEGATGSR